MYLDEKRVARFHEDGYVIVPEEATGLDSGTEVDVTLYR